MTKKNDHWTEGKAHLDAAQAVLKRALEIGRSDLESWLDLAAIQTERIHLSHYTSGIDAEAAYRLGLSLVDGARALDPSDGRVPWRRAHLARIWGHALESRSQDPLPAYQEALRAMEVALRLAPGDTKFLLDSGRIRCEIGRNEIAHLRGGLQDLEAAEKDLRQVVAAEPGNAEALRLLVEVSIHRAFSGFNRGEDVRERFHATADLAEQLLRSAPDVAGGRSLLLMSKIQSAICASARGGDPLADLEDAIATGNRLIAESPGNETLLLNLAVAYRYRAQRHWQAGQAWRGDLETAITLLRRSLAIRPDWSLGWACLGWCQAAYGTLGEDGKDPRPSFREALSSLRKGAEFGPKDHYAIQYQLDVLLEWARRFPADLSETRTLLASVQALLDRLRKVDPQGQSWYSARRHEVLALRAGALGQPATAEWRLALQELADHEKIRPYWEDLTVPGLKARLLLGLGSSLSGPAAAEARSKAEALLTENPLLRREYGNPLPVRKREGFGRVDRPA